MYVFIFFVYLIGLEPSRKHTSVLVCEGISREIQLREDLP